MKTLLLSLAAAAALLPAHGFAARLQDPQKVMAMDLNACARPAYPALALAQGAGGRTTVEVQIGAQGRVTEARIVTSSGRADLDEAALQSVRGCPFLGVLATGQVPTGWLKTQYVWIPGAAKKEQAESEALLAATRKRAEAGDPIAQNMLGAWYQSGTHVQADPAQAAAWYLPAAQAGNAIAQNNLGVLYHRGLGVPQDQKQAVYWYAKAAEQGHGWAQANLSWAYQHGTAGDIDMDKALYWLTRSAEGGLADAQLRLGRSFELGIGSIQDDAQAAALYRKALGRSGGRAEVALGRLLAAGRASPMEADEASRLFQKAMRSRHPDAYYHYGLILEQDGDLELARAVFLQGAQLGQCEAAVKYAELGGADLVWEQRAQWCKARPALPPQF